MMNPIFIVIVARYSYYLKSECKYKSLSDGIIARFGI